jgi:hypothetical protein
LTVHHAHGHVKVKANKEADLVLLAGVAERRHGQRAGSAAAAVRLDDARSDDDGEAQGRRQEQQRERDGGRRG